MTTNDQGTDTGSPSEPPPAPEPNETGWSDRGYDPHAAASTFTHPENLRRSRSDRKLAGVCGGLGRQLGIDPTVVRVAMVALTIAGGIGIPLYLVLALVMPNEGEQSTPVTSALAPHLPEQVRSGPGLAIVLGAIVVVSGLIVASIGDGFGRWPSFPLVVAGCVVAWLVVRRRNRTRTNSAGSATATSNGFRPATTHRVFVPTDPADPGAPGAEFWSRPDPLGLYDDVAAPPQATPPAASPAGKTRIKRAPIGLVVATIALAGLSLAGLVAVAVAGVAVPPLLFPTVPALVVGIGLLVAARLGGSRLLVVAGILLGIASVGVTRADLPSDIGAITTYAPTTVAQAKAIGRVGNGRNVVDLSDVDFAKTSPTIDLSIGSGVLTVILPDTLDTDVTVDVQRGGWNLFGTKTGGQFDPDQPTPVSITDTGSDGRNAAGPQLNLDIDVTDAGYVQVERSAA